MGPAAGRQTDPDPRPRPPATFGVIAVSGLSLYAVLNMIFQLVEKGPVLIGGDTGDLRPPHSPIVAVFYAPLLAWGPLLAAVTVAYHRRRTHTGQP